MQSKHHGVRGVACACLLGMLLASGAPTLAQDKTAHKPIRVEVKKTEKGFELVRDGKPYRVCGAGGRSKLQALVDAGGNSIRTWHTRGMDKVLDRAHSLGLSVTVGIWLQHERHGFDYRNKERVRSQHEEALAAVRKYKDHPAVLMWGIGNEMEADGSHPRVWKAVNRLAKAIKEIDPHHPTMTVVAGTYNEKIRQFIKHCPDIDVLGVNDYGDLRTIPDRLQEQGLDRPYIVTEFGPFGWWQVGKTSWGAEFEPTSTAKAKTYQASYQSAVINQADRCFGAYAFLWGHKQEHTHTWFGMFLPTGERTGSVDVMTKMWTGKWPANRTPALASMTFVPEGQAQKPSEYTLAAGSKVNCKVEGSDPDGDPVKIRWELRRESSDKKSGGDPEKVPETIKDVIVQGDDGTCVLTTPTEPGPYRLFVFLTDGNGGAATANVPFRVR